MNLDRPRVLVTLICLFCLPILLAACKSGPDTCRTSKALLEDSFNNTRCGWPKYDQRDSAAGMTASEYSLIVRKAETTIFARPPLHTTDVLLETEVRHISGTEHNNYGLVCRQSGPHDFYAFIISGDGYYGIMVSTSENGPRMLTGDGIHLMPSDSILTEPGVVNELRAICDGEELTLSVNGQVLDQIYDRSHVSGQFGFQVSTYEEAPVEVRFDNFIALDLSSPELGGGE